MISNLKFNELSGRVDSLLQRVDELESKLKSLVAEFGISTKKGEELAQNTGMMMKHKGVGYLVHDEKFREAAGLVLKSAKRKYGSAYWYHPLVGKFQMSGGIPK